MTLGWLYTANKKPDLASEIYESLVMQFGREEFRPDWVRALNASGSFDQAAGAVDAAPLSSPELVLEKAKALRGLGNPEAALAALNAVNENEVSDRAAYLVEMPELL